jgi:hypothetical protein
MVIVAIIRVSGIHYHGKFDNTWIFMWQQVEACIAVTMLSLTAFQSVFVAAKPSLNNHKANPWVPSTRRLLARYRKSAASDKKCLDEVVVPSATLTGLSQVFIHPKPTQSMEENITSNNSPSMREIEHEEYTQV